MHLLDAEAEGHPPFLKKVVIHGLSMGATSLRYMMVGETTSLQFTMVPLLVYSIARTETSILQLGRSL